MIIAPQPSVRGRPFPVADEEREFGGGQQTGIRRAVGTIQ